MSVGVLSCSDRTSESVTDTARVVTVRDGDTIELDDGRVVRYIGINTPERGKPGADSATALNTALVMGKKVRLQFGHDRIDRYGHTLALVFADDVCVNEALVRAGWAWCYFFEGNLLDSDRLVLALQEAMDARRGLWREASGAADTPYIGSFLGHRFHYPECASVAAIELEYELQFISRDSAFYYGYAPCANCAP